MERKIILFALVGLLVAACAQHSSETTYYGEKIEFHHARNIEMWHADGYDVATMRNPWDTTRVLQTYILRSDTTLAPSQLPKGQIIDVPVTNAVVYTSVHASLLDELGAIDAISGVADAQYINNASIRTRIDSGVVADCGKSMDPDIERIIMLKPQIIMVSAYENASEHNKVSRTGTTIVDCAEYMEPTPLAQAEWMRFYGRLVGAGERADSIFRATEEQYTDIATKVSQDETKPIVLFDRIYGSSWNVPAALSTAGILLEDAGGKNPFDSYRRSGALQLSPEEVLMRAHNADVWFVRYFQDSPLTLGQIAADNKIYTQIKAFNDGNVYGCNTQQSTFFDDIIFHPQWLLAEYATLLHPEVEIDYTPRYYTLLEP